MNDFRDSHHYYYDQPRSPGAITWFFKQISWYLRRLILWPIVDTFRWFGRGIARFFRAFRYRSPFAYFAGMLVFAVTAAAVGAAAYFYKQSASTVAPPAAEQTVDRIVPAEPVTPTPEPEPAPVTTVAEKPSEPTLQGVVPNFDQTAADKPVSTVKKKKQTKTTTLVKPAAAPKSGPLLVAHNFAASFVGYEIGDKKATGKFSSTALPRLVRDLKANPPKQPSGARVPKATVMNVVKGKRTGKFLEVSVALLRAGATNDLRLVLKQTGSGWRVSEVRG